MGSSSDLARQPSSSRRSILSNKKLYDLRDLYRDVGFHGFLTQVHQGIVRIHDRAVAAMIHILLTLAHVLNWLASNRDQRLWSEVAYFSPYHYTPPGFGEGGRERSRAAGWVLRQSAVPTRLASLATLPRKGEG